VNNQRFAASGATMSVFHFPIRVRPDFG
jgi:hypothetical protein